MTTALEVWLDSDLTDGPTLVGMLHSDRGQARFEYASGWLGNPRAFALDPDLSLGKGAFFPSAETANFGVFLDSSPDRWGQTLMKRREALDATNEGRRPRNLYAWDYLVGVQDLTRQGALRFKLQGTQDYLGKHSLAAPPMTDLRELADIALQLSRKKIDDLAPLDRWLSVLVAPGASLGGARPKANFREMDESLWIAKFPASDDDRDIGAWEGIAHSLAVNAGVDVPVAKTVKLSSEHHTFCVRRFDRVGGQRIFYASAMTLLRKSSSEGSSYLELAQFLQRNGQASTVNRDLAQLFKRVVFNVAIGNRDDHLRNHGFLHTQGGWRLSPAFDVNPNVDKADHVLNLDDSDNRPDVGIVLATAAFYGLEESEGRQIVQEVGECVAAWEQIARSAGMNNAEISGMGVAFSALDNWPDPPSISRPRINSL